MLVRRSTASSDIAIVAAATFAVIAALVGGIADGPWRHVAGDKEWQLRGTLAPIDALRIESLASRTRAA